MANNASSDPIPLIMTRPLGASKAFVEGLPPAVRDRFAPLYSPLMHIVPLGAVVPMTQKDAAIFSSSSGVDMAPEGAGRQAFCVGQATTNAANGRGWHAVQCGVDAQTLVETLLSMRPAQRLFHLSGRHTRGDIAEKLSRAGMRIERISIYDQPLCDLTPEAAQTIEQESFIVVPLFSPRTAAQFAKVAPSTTCLHIVALSQSVADAFGDKPVAGLTIVPLPDAKAMGTALIDLA